MNDSVAKDVWFLMLFMVLPASGAMIGGAYIGGWVLHDCQPWGVAVVIAGVLAAFGLIKLAVQIMQWADDENNEIRGREIRRQLGLLDE